MADKYISQLTPLGSSTTYLLKDKKAIENITRSGTTFTATRRDGTTFTFTQQDNNSVTGVKGNAETNYRTGNVNLTLTNIIGNNAIGTGSGGTGNTSFTGSRLIYSETATKLASGTIISEGNTITFNQSADIGLIKNTYNNTVYNVIKNHNNGNISVSASSVGLYLGYENTTIINFLSSKGAWDSTGLGIGTTSPSYKLHVVGNSYFSGNTTHNGIDYFANGTTYQINNAADGYLRNLKVRTLGIAQTDGDSCYGISLYGGPVTSKPTYGLLFAHTSQLGKHGDVSSDWATYFTMSNHIYRGWIFQRGTINVASISGRGYIYSGGTDNAYEGQIHAVSGAGDIYLYSQTTATGTRGIYTPAHGTGPAHYVISVNTNNLPTYYGGQLMYRSLPNKTDHALALKDEFDNNKADIPRAQQISYYDTVSSNGSMAMGYFIAGHDTDPYGGFFVAHYNNPYYVGIQSGTYTQQHILTSTNYTSYTVKKDGTGASGTWGISITGNAATATNIAWTGVTGKPATTLVTDTGTSTISLAYGGKYKLTAAGSSVIFTMPTSDNTNTWRKIQVNDTDILGTGTNTNPLNLKAGSNVTITNNNGTVTIASSYTNTWTALSTSAAGYVAKAPNDTHKFLRGDATWADITSAKSTTLAWNTESTIATVGGYDIKVKLPANPNTNTDTLVKQTAKTDDKNYKLLFTASDSPVSGSAAEAAYDTNITLNPSTNTITATNFEGSATNAKNTQSIHGKKDFTVNGDANTYYPTLFTGFTGSGASTLLSIHRNYNEAAPNTWNTETHRGGLTLTILSNGDTAYGGNHALGIQKLNTILVLSQSYCTMVGDIQNTNFGLVIWLRGGGAAYHVTSNGGRSVNVTTWYESHTQSSQTVEPITVVNTTRINSYRWENLWTIATATTASNVAWSGITGKPTTTLATDTGTSTITLTYGGKYKLTAADSSVIFTMPAAASAVDNILDGSNSGTAITYAPYTSQQAKLSFDTSTTNPSRTDRLNLNGYLYATKFIGPLQGNADTATAANITSTDNAIVRFDGTTGKFQNSNVTIDDNGYINSTQFKTSSSETILNDIGYITIYPYDRNTYGNTTPTPAKFIFTEKAYTTGVPAKTLVAWSGIDNIKVANFIGALKGNADTATALATARTIQTNLASTSAASFDGTANITPGVTGTLGTANGGTGNTSYTVSRLIYSETTTKLASGVNLYTDGSVLAVNSTSITTGFKFQVTGEALFTASGTDRARLRIRTVADQPNDLYLGNNNVDQWSITSRESANNYDLMIYSTGTNSLNRDVMRFNHSTGQVNIFTKGITDILVTNSNQTDSYIVHTSSKGTWKAGLASDEYHLYSNTKSNWILALNYSNIHYRSAAFSQQVIPDANASNGLYFRDYSDKYLWYVGGYKYKTSGNMMARLITYGNDGSTADFNIIRTGEETPRNYITWSQHKVGHEILPLNNSSYNLGSNDLIWKALYSSTIIKPQDTVISSSTTIRSHYIVAPLGGSYATNASSTTGLLKIEFPVRWTSHMINFKVDIYDYSQNNLVTYHIGGYNYSGNSSWHNTSAYSVGIGDKSNLTVRFCDDGTHTCVTIGETNTTWSYIQVNVKDVYIGYNSSNINDWNNTWKISFVTTQPTVSNNQEKIDTNTGITRINREKHPFDAFSTSVGITPLNIFGLKNGYPVYTDPEFASGVNSVGVYNNSSGGNVVHTRQLYSAAGIPHPGTSNGYVITIQTKGAASPGIGGFVQTITSRANAIFVQIFRALIPVGRKVVNASNAMGTSYTDKWLTSQDGTGKWEWYARIVHCGKDGTFSSGGHVYLNGAAATASAPVTWHLAFCNLYDITKGEYDGLRVREADKLTDITTADAASSSATWRYVWFSYDNNKTGRPAYSSNLVFQTSTNTLKATKFQGALVGNADTATALGTVGTIKVNLASTSAVTYTSGGNITPGVTGTLGTANGGTGNTSFTASRLVYTNTATKLASSNIVSDGNYISNVTYLSIYADHQTNYRLYSNGSAGVNGHIHLQGAAASRQTAPSSNDNRVLYFTDAARNAGGYIYFRHDTSNSHIMYLGTYSASANAMRDSIVLVSDTNATDPHYININSRINTGLNISGTRGFAYNAATAGTHISAGGNIHITAASPYVSFYNNTSASYTGYIQDTAANGMIFVHGTAATTAVTALTPINTSFKPQFELRGLTYVNGGLMANGDTYIKGRVTTHNQWNIFYLPNFTKETAPSSTIDGGIIFRDKDGENINLIRAYTGTSNNRSLSLYTYGNHSNAIELFITSNEDGTNCISWTGGRVNNSILPHSNNDKDLGSNALRWRTLYLKGGINYQMNADTSNAKSFLQYTNTSNAMIAEIGFHNTGNTTGAFYIIPHNHSGVNAYSGTVGLYIGKTVLKWEDKHIALSNNATAFTLNQGTANRLAYYSAAGAISSGNIVSEGNYISSVTYLSVNASHQTNYRLYVNGTSYLANNLYINAVGSNYGIYAVGTKATYRMIRFIDNTGDTYGNGIVIGGGGLTILGSGESGDTLYSNLGYTGGSEITVIGSDGEIAFYPGNNSYDASAKLSMTASRFWAGVNGNTTREAQVGVQSGAGQLYLWSAASTTGVRGLWSPAHGSGVAQYVVQVDNDNIITHHGGLTMHRTISGTSHAVGLQTEFNNNKATVPRNQLISYYSSAHSNGSQAFGYFLAGHDTEPYGGFFVAHYNTPRYVGIQSGTYTQWRLLKGADSGAIGGTSTPIYIDADGIAQPCTAYGSATDIRAKTVYINNDTSTKLYVLGATTTGYTNIYRESSVTIESNILKGAAWNDYAEYRQAKNNSNISAGKVVYENGDDTLSISTQRLMRGCNIVSDTYGFAIGESEKAQLPIAVSGRVLAYPYESREEFKNHIGWPVCSGPNGTVSIMTEEEEMKYPSRIIGIISAVPDYEIWHGGVDVVVDGRVWIKVK